MWRGVLAVILLPALTAAQAAQTTPQPGTYRANCGQGQADRSVPRRVEPQSTPYTKYNGIRRGTKGEVAVQLTLAGFVTTPKSAVSGVVPLQLDLEPAEGLKVGKITYPKPNVGSIQFRADRIPVVGSPTIRFKVGADRKTRLGIHLLKGTLTFQPVRADTGAGPVQHMDVEIPINVVEHDAVLQTSQWPFYQTPVALIVVVIVLSPVLVAAVIPIMAACALTTRTAFCND